MSDEAKEYIDGYFEPEIGSHRYKEVIAETDKAWLIAFNKRIQWLPKSQCKLRKHRVLVPEWLWYKGGIKR